MERLGPWPNSSDGTDTLIVATFDYPPFTFVDPARPNVVTGYLKDLLDIMAEEVGVSLVYDTNNTVGDFGVQRADGSFSGLVGRLVSKTAHVALAPLTYRQSRQEVIDYIGVVPVAAQRFDFLVPGQKRASMSSIQSLLMPFDVNVWICLVVGMLTAAVLLRLTVSLTRPRHSDDCHTFGVVSSLLHVYACVVQQGWSSTPSRFSPWLVMMAARLMSYIIYVEYTATLVAVMTVLQTRTEVGSVQEFVTDSGWSLLIQKGVGYSSDWKTSREPSLRTIYQRMETGEGIKLLTANTAQQIFEPKTVTSFDRKQAFFLLGSRACELVTLPMRPVSGAAEMEDAAHGRLTPVFLTMQTNMKIRPHLDRVLQRMIETGAVKRLYSRWFWNATTMSCDTSSHLRALSTEDISAMFLIVPAGVILSLVLLLLEHVLVRCASNADIHYLSRPSSEDPRPVEHQLWRM